MKNEWVYLILTLNCLVLTKIGKLLNEKVDIIFFGTMSLFLIILYLFEVWNLKIVMR